MSRETDSPSSGPQGRGGAAYPSGTPPYGPRPFPSLHPQERPRPAGQEQDAAEAAEPAADAAGEPRTETTLTTRIRINIPGSRPIPPVVMRTTVEEGAAPAAVPGSGGTAAAGEAAGEAAPEGEAEPAPAEKKEKASDWFAPRKPVAGAPGAAGGAEPGLPPGGAPGVGATGDGFSEGFSGDGFQGDFQGGGGQRSGGTAGGGFTVPPAAGGPPAMGTADGFFGTGSPVGGTPAGGTPAGDDPFAGPYAEPFADPDTGTQQIPQAFLPPPAGSPFDGGPGVRGSHDTPAGGFGSPFDDSAAQDFRAGAAPFGPDDFPPGVPRPVSTDPFAPDEAVTGPPGQPTGPTAGPATGDMPVPPQAGAHAFRPPAPVAADPPARRDAGDTLVGGIPAVPAGESRTRPAPGPGAVPAPAPAPAPASPAAPAASAKKPAKKGRSKLVLLGVAVGGALVLAYGAGLLMNHSDVPKGTTVLGVDIGNTSQETAVRTLDHALGNRGTADLTVTVGGKQHTLKPSVAGLSIDTDATVRKVAHADYNPVSVLGTLVGDTHTADPVIVIDEDKLKAALKTVAGRSSAGSEGMVRFSDGKAVAVPGKPSQAVDVDAAATQVSAAYRLRAASGRNTPVDLRVTTVQPKVTQAELTAAVNGFGKTAMDGPVVVRAGYYNKVTFDSTLPQFLTMQPTPDGKLTPHIDLKVLQSLYGSSFAQVTLERGDGSRTAVTPKDVATALIQALNAKTPAGRDVDLLAAGR